VSISRIALRPFTFSNGVTVPAGTRIAVPSAAVHSDEEIYPNPEEFDGFRFAKLREHDGDGMPVAGHQLTLHLGITLISDMGDMPGGVLKALRCRRVGSQPRVTLYSSTMVKPWTVLCG